MILRHRRERAPKNPWTHRPEPIYGAVHDVYDRHRGNNTFTFWHAVERAAPYRTVAESELRRLARIFYGRVEVASRENAARNRSIHRVLDAIEPAFSYTWARDTWYYIRDIAPYLSPRPLCRFCGRTPFMVWWAAEAAQDRIYKKRRCPTREEQKKIEYRSDAGLWGRLGVCSNRCVDLLSRRNRGDQKCLRQGKKLLKEVRGMVNPHRLA